MAVPRFTLRALAISLPGVFALHVAEEAPHFVAWFNAHVEPDITARSFRSVSVAGFVITLVDRGYVPGVVTAALLYLPVSLAFMRAASREYGIAPATVAFAALVGGIPMYLHGWQIVFEGGRFF